MDLERVALLVHFVGFALGLGGASVSDVTFFKALRKRSLSVETYAFLAMLSKIIWVGLGLLVVSGLTFFVLSCMEQGSVPMLSSPKWQAKLILVGIILINGLFFRFAIFPRLKAVAGQTLGLNNIGPMIGKLALVGTISIWSWYATLVVTLVPRTFRPPLWQFLAAYLLILVLGVLCSRKFISRSVK